MELLKLSSIFAPMYCDNFFASCEHMLQPDFEDRPVVLLTSNDGPAVTRSISRWSELPIPRILK